MRRTITVDITAEGRDRGKRFLITELPSTKAEKWAARAINALLASGIEIDDAVAASGLRGLAASGLASLASFKGVPWDLLEPLLDEMMTCVQIVPDPARPAVIRPLIEEDIEELMTRLQLRAEWIDLHMGFSTAASFRTSDSAADGGDRSST